MNEIEKKIEAYKNELTTTSRLFYKNGSDVNPDKVKAHKKFLYGLFTRLENEPAELKRNSEFIQFRALVLRASENIKLTKKGIAQRIALGLYSRFATK